MPRKRLGTAVALVVYLLAARAAADPAPSDRLRMRDSSSLTLKSGRVLELPPGRFTEERTFEKDETELKRLQDQETKLGAENRSLRDSAAGWQPGWRTLLLAVASGAMIGFYVAK